MTKKATTSLADLPVQPKARTPEVLPPESPKEKTEDMERQFAMQDLPSDRKLCFQKLTTAVAALKKSVTCKMWFIGKLLTTLESREEKNIMPDAVKATGYAERTLHTAKTFYQTFENYDDLDRLSACLEWSNVRLLSKVKKEENRKDLCDKVESGDLDDKTLPQAVKEITDKEREEKGAVKPDKRTTKNKEKDIVGIFLKAEREISKMKTEFLKLSKDILGSGPKDQTAWLGILVEDELTSKEQYDRAKKHVEKLMAACNELGASAADLFVTLKREVP